MEDQVHDPEPRDEDVPASSNRQWTWDDAPEWFVAPSAHALSDHSAHSVTIVGQGQQSEQDPLASNGGRPDTSVPPAEWHLVEEPAHTPNGLEAGSSDIVPPAGLEEQDDVAHGRERSRTKWKGILREIAETAILTLLIFVLMRAVVQNYRIEGYSMEPNLHEQEYLIVNKVSYYLGEPQRGDIIVFEFPGSHLSGPEKDYIKRVIGLPGDTVECRPGEILVNGQVIDEPYGPNPGSYYCPPTVLGPSEYFVLGDNRNQSSDSHSWGPLERRFIIGKAWLLYWPLENFGLVPSHPIGAPDPQQVVNAQ
jgi:signal peptidase I